MSYARRGSSSVINKLKRAEAAGATVTEVVRVRELVFSRTKSDNLSVFLVGEDKETTYLFTVMFSDQIDTETEDAIIRSMIEKLETDDSLVLTEDRE